MDNIVVRDFIAWGLEYVPEYGGDMLEFLEAEVKREYSVLYEHFLFKIVEGINHSSVKWVITQNNLGIVATIRATNTVAYGDLFSEVSEHDARLNILLKIMKEEV